MPYTYPFALVGEETKLAVWGKGQIMEEEGGKWHPNIWRRDICGRAMRYTDHGNINSKFGWEIDHIQPEAHGGITSIDNLQPLHWKNNRSKGDTYPWSCP